MMTVPTMIQSVRCVNNKRTRVGISCSICAVVQRNRIRLGTPVWVFAPICLDSSDRLLKLERISIFTSISQNELRKLQWNPPSHDSNELDRRDGGTVLSSPRGQRRYLETWQKWTARKLSESIRSYRRNCARHFNPKQQLTWRVTRTECCGKKFTSRDIWSKKKTRTMKPRQHGLCQSGKSGSSSNSTVTWDIRSPRSWLVRYGTQEQGEKLYGWFSKSYVVQRAKHTPSRNVTTLFAF